MPEEVQWREIVEKGVETFQEDHHSRHTALTVSGGPGKKKCLCPFPALNPKTKLVTCPLYSLSSHFNIEAKCIASFRLKNSSPSFKQRLENETTGLKLLIEMHHSLLRARKMKHMTSKFQKPQYSFIPILSAGLSQHNLCAAFNLLPFSPLPSDIY